MKGKITINRVLSDFHLLPVDLFNETPEERMYDEIENLVEASIEDEENAIILINPTIIICQ